MELVKCLFCVVAVVVLLGDVYSAADKMVSHSSGHGCGGTSFFEINRA